eukprot:GHVP01043919.1.p1 GENE.GHVP01043919.1~~GHVP01043919.1.p1  ORF type:complete len:365 (+),score=80.67 GHVP01043919.1:18-1112(+)
MKDKGVLRLLAEAWGPEVEDQHKGRAQKAIAAFASHLQKNNFKSEDEKFLKIAANCFFHIVYGASGFGVWMNHIVQIVQILGSGSMEFRLAFFKAQCEVLAEKWESVDSHRINKTQKWIRVLMAEILDISSFDLESTTAFTNVLEEGMSFQLHNAPGSGCRYHFCDVFLEEWHIVCETAGLRFQNQEASPESVNRKRKAPDPSVRRNVERNLFMWLDVFLRSSAAMKVNAVGRRLLKGILDSVEENDLPLGALSVAAFWHGLRNPDSIWLAEFVAEMDKRIEEKGIDSPDYEKYADLFDKATEDEQSDSLYLLNLLLPEDPIPKSLRFSKRKRVIRFNGRRPIAEKDSPGVPESLPGRSILKIK